jgi:hypothetical protein
MQFKGRLLLPDEPGPGLRVDLDVAEHHLAVESDGAGLGAWPLEVVDVERLHGDIFSLTVAGESLRFVADDTIAFAYSGMPTIERVSRRPRTRSGLRTMLDRIWNGPHEPASSVGVQPASDEGPSRHGHVEENLPPGANAGETSEAVEHASDVMIEADDVVVGGEDIILSSRADLSGSSLARADLADSAGCPGIRSDGRRCESPILTSSGYCYPHDPRRAFENRYKAAQEARTQLKEDATERLNRIYSRLEKAMRQVERGDLDPETAMAMAQLARTMCAILEMDEPAAGDHR